MNLYVTIVLFSIMENVCRTEVPLGSCSADMPFRMDDGICSSFTDICIKKDSSQCKSLLNACSQCSPSEYTISMLATLNKKINELSQLKKEISKLSNFRNETKDVSNYTREMNDNRILIISTREDVKEMKIYGKIHILFEILNLIIIMALLWQVLIVVYMLKVKNKLIKEDKEISKKFILYEKLLPSKSGISEKSSSENEVKPSIVRDTPRVFSNEQQMNEKYTDAVAEVI